MNEPKCCSCLEALTGIKVLAILEVLAILSVIWFVGTIAFNNDYYKCKDAMKYKSELIAMSSSLSSSVRKRLSLDNPVKSCNIILRETENNLNKLKEV